MGGGANCNKINPHLLGEVKWKSLSRVRLFATAWTIQSVNSPSQNIGVGSLSLVQRIFLTQELNQGLPHCRQILYQLSYQENPPARWVTQKLENNCITEDWGPEESGKIYLKWWKGKSYNQDYSMKQGYHSDSMERSKTLQVSKS